MALPSTYTQAYGVLKDFFSSIRDAQAPDKFTHQILKDLGYKSNTHRAFIPMMKALGFLTADGTPTKRYIEYRDHSQSERIMGEAIKEAYSDIFLIKAKPSTSDKDLIQGKFKSFHNTSNNTASLMTKNFFALLELADLDEKENKTEHKPKIEPQKTIDNQPIKQVSPSSVGLHYNIQIHLPATKDVEVYNAIFKSLKEHLIE